MPSNRVGTTPALPLPPPPPKPTLLSKCASFWLQKNSRCKHLVSQIVGPQAAFHCHLETSPVQTGTTHWKQLKLRDNYVPRHLYRPWLIQARIARVMRSPKLAAMGVATLSGLMPVFFEPTITPTMRIPGRTQI